MSRSGPAPRSAALRLAVAVVVGAAIAVSVAACGGPGPTATPSATESASPRPSASVVIAPSASGSSIATGIAVDPSLLGIVPSAVDGVPVEPDPGTAAQIASDPALAADVEALAVGLALGPGASGAEDLAIVNVVRLRDGVFGEAFFRSWRDSYDAAACEPAGGVVGHAQAELAGRTVFIGSCTNGAFTHHVALEGDGIIVSVTSLGERRFGEQIVSNLTP